MRFISTLILFSLLGLWGCGTIQNQSDKSTLNVSDSKGVQSNSALSSEIISRSEVSPGFLFELTNQADPALNGKFRVDFEGDLDLPYHVRVKTKNQTLDEVIQAVKAAFLPFLKSSQEFQVQLIQKRYWLEVRGLVKNPGRQLARRTTSLEELFAKAGGLLPKSEEGFISLVSPHPSTTPHQIISMKDYFSNPMGGTPIEWQGGEIILVQLDSLLSQSHVSLERPIVDVMGEVRSPGEIRFKEGDDLLYYIKKAGGPTQYSDLDHIDIIRDVNHTQQKTTYSLSSLNPFPAIQSKDLILIYPRKPEAFSQTMQIVGGFAGILSSIAVLILAFNH